MIELLAISGKGVVSVPLNTGFITVGGKDSAGVKVPGLRFSSDYVVVGNSENTIFAHSLRNKKSARLELKVGQTLSIDDLQLCVLNRTEASSELRGSIPQIESLLNDFSASSHLQPALEKFLKILIDLSEMEKGVLIMKSDDGKFISVAKEGVRSNDPWLSEALVQEALSNRKPIWVHNRVGSSFESSKSLVAVGFLSAFAIPLTVRGETIGLAVVGSALPHSGLSESQKTDLITLAQMGSVLFWFHQRDAAAQKEIDRLAISQSSINGCPLITVSSRLQQEIEIAHRLASTRLSVLIQGETGVGKELMAKWIHNKSDRKDGPFIPLNCGSIPSELLESILFGHKRGSFTGAISDQIGKFQSASGGTLLLDEIGDLPEILQVKLLRVLQEGTIDPLGSNRSIKVDVRIISATHRNLERLVDQGKFRKDLYFRIAETMVTIPPLRERPEDIGLLATHFLKEIDAAKKLSPESLLWLSQLPWPGNVRELQSAVKRAAALCLGNELRRESFLLGLSASTKVEESDHWLGGESLEDSRHRFVMQKIKMALERSSGNRNQAAELLKITPRTLFRYLEEGRQNGHDA